MARKTKMSQFKNNNPGPGTYTPAYKLAIKKYNKPKYVFGYKTKTGKSKLNVPGPGTYQHKSNISKRPSSKFGR